MAVQVFLRRNNRETGNVFFFCLGTDRSNQPVRNAPCPSWAAGTMCPVPASGTQQAGAFSWLRADADVVAVVND